jgi:hypothetical protein
MDAYRLNDSDPHVYQTQTFLQVQRDKGHLAALGRGLRYQ